MNASTENNLRALLKTENLGIRFGGLDTVREFAMEIHNDELIGLIGPNGAGKTTVFNMITGVYTPTTGDIFFDGKSVVGKRTNEINNLGVARTFQNIRLFKNLTVIDNVKIACNYRMKYSPFSGIFRLPAYWDEEDRVQQEAMSILEVFGLDSLADAEATNLPYGKQRKLEIARALATHPRLLLLDEPAAGMNPSETRELMDTIKLIREKFDIAILLIEHDMHLVMGICEKIIVLDYGVIIARGVPDEIKNDKKVIAAYLGE